MAFSRPPTPADRHEFRTYANIVGDYWVAPKFLDAVSLHICKNYLAVSHPVEAENIL
jgi:hypothetical protein